MTPVPTPHLDAGSDDSGHSAYGRRLPRGSEPGIIPLPQDLSISPPRPKVPTSALRGLVLRGVLVLTAAAALAGPGQPEPGLPTVGAERLSESSRCNAEDVLRAGGCVLDQASNSLAFSVHSSGSRSINHLTISPAGLEIDNRPVTAETDGVVTAAEIADLDADGWPEVYVYISSAGSGSYGSLVAYAVNRGKSMSPIYLPPLADDPDLSTGYMGHDHFAVTGNRLLRRFPVYLPGDTNHAPSGGMRQLEYRLSPGEAGWLLVADRVVNFEG